MLIRDLEQKTELDRATIRFYEKEGFINPSREENGYRTYSEDDCNTLLKIKLMRQLGFGLEKIKLLQAGTLQLQSVLEEQINSLNGQVDQLNRAGSVCKKMREDCAQYNNLDVHSYLNYYQTQQHTQPRKEFKESIQREFHPWRRLIGREIDYALFMLIIRFLLVVVLRIRPFGQVMAYTLAFATPYILIPFESFCLSKWGTTPGKCLMGLRVESENGGLLTYSEALDREWAVLRDGLGYCIPIWEIWRRYRSYREYEEGSTDWDWRSEYIYAPIKNQRKVTVACMIVVFVLLTIWIANDAVLPANRGDLTIADFAKNYNFYYTTSVDTVDINKKLQPDGTFDNDQSNGFIIDIFGVTPDKEHAFVYTTEGDYITEVSYSNTWSDVSAISAIPDHCIYATLAIAMAQKHMGNQEMQELAKLMDEEIAAGNSEVQIVYKNIEIRWKIIATNCHIVDAVYWIDNEADKAAFSLDYSVVIH